MINCPLGEAVETLLAHFFDFVLLVHMRIAGTLGRPFRNCWRILTGNLAPEFPGKFY
jgi:hypothetical protein